MAKGWEVYHVFRYLFYALRRPSGGLRLWESPLALFLSRGSSQGRYRFELADRVLSGTPFLELTEDDRILFLDFLFGTLMLLDWAMKDIRRFTMRMIRGPARASRRRLSLVAGGQR